MVTSVSARRRPAVFAVLGIVLALAGCQSGNPLGALNIGGGGAAQQPPADDGRITPEELLAYCPRLTIRNEDAVHDSYQRGGQGDPQKLVFRASISDATRACNYAGGTLSMTIAAAGRVIPGPVATTGAVRLPIRVTVYRDTEIIHDQVHDYQVAIGDTAGATQFVFTDASLSMPNPTARNIRIFVGYDNPEPAEAR